MAVLFGGRSAEHDVSCISARHVVSAMDPDKYEVVPIGITRDGRWMLPDASRKVLEGGSLEIPESSFSAEGEQLTVIQDPSRTDLVASEPTGPIAIDVVFPVMHGPNGEDGTIQGMLELIDRPYVGSGVLGSALAMDKEKMKQMFYSVGLPIVDFVVIHAHEWTTDRDRLLDEGAWLGFPCFTKPANLGSSVGISKCLDLDSLALGIEAALLHDEKVLVEEGIVGRELECGVLGNEVPETSVVGEVLPGRDFYDYQAKYIDDSSSTVIPADLPEPIEELVRKYSIRAFKAVDAKGMARVDFFYEPGGRGVIVNEINTIPGFTTISMYPKLWEATGLTYSALIDRLVELAISRHRTKRRHETLPPAE